MPVAVIAVEGHGRRFARFFCVPGPVSRIDQEQVLSAVSIEIEESHTAAHRFRQQLVTISAVVMEEANAGLRGDVFERDGWDFRLRLRRTGGRGDGRDAGGLLRRFAIRVPNRRARPGPQQQQSDHGTPEGPPDHLVVQVSRLVRGLFNRCRTVFSFFKQI